MYDDRERALLNRFRQSVLVAVAGDKLAGAELWNFAPALRGETRREEAQALSFEGGNVVVRKKKGAITSEFQFTSALTTFLRVVAIIKPNRLQDLLDLQEQLHRWIGLQTMNWEGALYYLEAVREERSGSSVPLASMHQVFYSIACNMHATTGSQRTHRGGSRQNTFSTHAGQPHGETKRGAGLPDTVFRRTRDTGGCIQFQLGKCKSGTSPHDRVNPRSGRTISVQHACSECKSPAHGWTTCPQR